MTYLLECQLCGKYKPVDQFNRSVGSGYDPRCKDCLKQERYNTHWRSLKTAISNKRDTHRRLGLDATLTVDEWLDILFAYNWRCAYCGRHESVDNILEQEHVIPIIQGGGYTKENIVPSCTACNRKKRGRTPEQAGMFPRRFQSTAGAS